MKERPILFSPQMVKAIQSGIKSQTRRVVKWPKHVNADAVCKVQPAPYYGHGTHGEFVPIQKMGGIATAAFSPHSIPCPYGVPGDRLWVKERWQHSTDARGTCVVRYEADNGALFSLAEDGGEGDFCGVSGRADPGRCMPVESWRSAASMKRWASHITLEVTDVRVERLQAISEADAIAEGCGVLLNDEMDRTRGARAQREYSHLWESINGAGSWAANPWVWVMGFKQAEVPHAG